MDMMAFLQKKPSTGAKASFLIDLVFVQKTQKNSKASKRSRCVSNVLLLLLLLLLLSDLAKYVRTLAYTNCCHMTEILEENCEKVDTRKLYKARQVGMKEDSFHPRPIHLCYQGFFLFLFIHLTKR